MSHPFSDFDFLDSPSPQSPRPPHHPLQLSASRYDPPTDYTPSEPLPENRPGQRQSILPEQVLPHQALHALKGDGLGYGYPAVADSASPNHKNKSASPRRRSRSMWATSTFHPLVEQQRPSSSTGSTPNIQQVMASRSALQLPQQTAMRVVNPAVRHHSRGAEAVEASVLRVFIGPLTPDWMTFSLRRRWRAYAPSRDSSTGTARGTKGVFHNDASTADIRRGPHDRSGRSSLRMTPGESLLHEPSMVPVHDLDMDESSGGHSFSELPSASQSPRSIFSIHTQASQRTRSGQSQYTAATTSGAASFYTAHEGNSRSTSQPASPITASKGLGIIIDPDDHQNAPSSPHSPSPADTSLLKLYRGQSSRADLLPGIDPPSPRFSETLTQGGRASSFPVSDTLDSIQDHIEAPLHQNQETTLVLSRVAPVAFRRDYCRPNVTMMHYNEYTAPKCRIMCEKWKHMTCLILPGEIRFYRRSEKKPLYTIYLSHRTRLSLYSSLDNSLAITYFEDDSKDKSRVHYHRSIRHYYRSQRASGVARRRSGSQTNMDLNVSLFNRESGSYNTARQASLDNGQLEPGNKSKFRSLVRRKSQRESPTQSTSHTLVSQQNGLDKEGSVQACIIRFPTSAEAKIWYRILHCHIIHVASIPRSIDLVCPTLSSSPFRFVKVEIPFQAAPVAACQRGDQHVKGDSPIPYAAKFAITGPRTIWDVRTMAAFELIVESEWSAQLAAWIKAYTLGLSWKRFDRIEWCFSNLTDGWDELNRQLILEGYHVSQLSEEEARNWSDDSSSSHSDGGVQRRNTQYNARPADTMDQPQGLLRPPAQTPHLGQATAIKDPSVRRVRRNTVHEHPLAATHQLQRAASTTYLNERNKVTNSRSTNHDDDRSLGQKSQRIADLRDQLSSRTAETPRFTHRQNTERRLPQPNATVHLNGSKADMVDSGAPTDGIMTENTADHSILNTYMLERSHELQLREYHHYPDSVVLPNGTEMPEPNPLEGYLLRRPKPRTYFPRYRQMFVMTFDHHLVCVTSHRAKNYIESTMALPPRNALDGTDPSHSAPDNGSPGQSAVSGVEADRVSQRHHSRGRGTRSRLGRGGLTTQQVLAYHNHPYTNDQRVNAADFVAPTSMAGAGRPRRSLAPHLTEPSRAPTVLPRRSFYKTSRSALARMFGTRSNRPNASFQRSVGSGRVRTAPPGDSGRARSKNPSVAHLPHSGTAGGTSRSYSTYRYHYSTHLKLATMLRHAGGFFDLTQIKYIYPVSSTGVSYFTDATSLMNYYSDGHSDQLVGSNSGVNQTAMNESLYTQHTTSQGPTEPPGRLRRMGSALKFWETKPRANESPVASPLYRHEVYQVVEDAAGREREEKVADAALRRETRFDIVMTNGAVLRLQAPTNSTMREWIRRILDLRTYWTSRLHADARHRAESARVNLGLRISVLGCESDVPEWQQSRTYADPLIWNVCRPLGCRTITQSGYLFRKRKRNSPFKRSYFIITRGYLIEFTPVQHASYSTIQPSSLQQMHAWKTAQTRQLNTSHSSTQSRSSVWQGSHSIRSNTSHPSRPQSWNSSRGYGPSTLPSATDGLDNLPGAPGRWNLHDQDEVSQQYHRHLQKHARKQSGKHGFHPRVRAIRLQGCFTMSRFVDDVPLRAPEDMARACRIYPDNIVVNDNVKDCVFVLWRPNNTPPIPQVARTMPAEVSPTCNGFPPAMEEGKKVGGSPRPKKSRGMSQLLPWGRSIDKPNGNQLQMPTNVNRHPSQDSFRPPSSTLSEQPNRSASSSAPLLPQSSLPTTPSPQRSAETTVERPEVAPGTTRQSPASTLGDRAMKSFPHHLNPSMGSWQETYIVFRARSRTEMEQWVSALNHEIERLQYQAEACPFI
ncbi:hypothetical protein IWQ62_003821 [Dispira parvispora]|uniref:PH domain-containing protein n=1 Tax=Dispira parvispora TaxID=1520584 RepID=A0A9W8AT23_9FUNG|nr:hypothetical protein IWQ62_003821 [Dispira parvispora]